MSLSHLYESNNLDNQTATVYSNSVTCKEIVVSTKVSLPKFRALKAVESIVSSSGQPLTTYDSKAGDLSATFDLATGRYTATEAGVYLLTAKCFHSSGGPATTEFIISICKNAYGADMLQETQGEYVGGGLAPSVSGTMYLNAGDFVFVQLFQTIASPLSVSSLEFNGVMI